MPTIRKTLFFGTNPKDKTEHTHKVSFTGDSIIIIDADDDIYANVIEILIDDWKDICQFILEEKRDYDFITNFNK
jgi:hypothetical protein